MSIWPFGGNAALKMPVTKCHGALQLVLDLLTELLFQDRQKPSFHEFSHTHLKTQIL